MRIMNFSATASLGLATLAAVCIAAPARAQNTISKPPSPPYTMEVTASRTWTNDDVDRLRAEAPISYFDVSAAPAAQSAQAAATPGPSQTANARPVRAQDPDWYAEQAASLQAELERRQGALQQYMQNIQAAKSRESMTSGIALDKDSIGVTPEAGVEILQADVSEIQARLDDLVELARRNGIPPGVLRG